MAISVFDVAAYILEKRGPMKLQKLVYYCQAWSLVWDEEPLFREEIEAWSNGPVVRELYDAHRGQFKLSSLPKGNRAKLNEYQVETINSVLEHYGDKDSQWLSDLTHEEDPWKEARHGLAPGQRGDRVIDHASMCEYYSALLSDS